MLLPPAEKSLDCLVQKALALLIGTSALVLLVVTLDSHEYSEWQVALVLCQINFES